MICREFWITINGLQNNNRVSDIPAKPVFKDDVVYHVREVDTSAPDYKKLAEDLAGALEVAIDELRVTSNLEYEYGIKVMETYRAAVGK